ncbi:MAG: hypothetical protein OXN17_02150 [Candidatus Poribacteria bacterium]|nr:hypothetical protein [Candidatus Poribacteria bacterium]MDE0503228.1 hypothetical protein [Candidatus Poribacteria bacterium]
MKRSLCIPLLVVSCFVAGCNAGFMSALVAPQEWSENYALLEGATCTAPGMIDGDLETVAVSQGRNIVVNLPTRKTIHRIVIRETNIEDLIVYHKIGGEGEWKRIDKIKKKRPSTIDMRVSVVTDAIRIRVGGTFDDERIAGQYSYQIGAVRNRQVKRGAPAAKEIELYGFVQKKPQATSESSN